MTVARDPNTIVARGPSMIVARDPNRAQNDGCQPAKCSLAVPDPSHKVRVW